MITDDRIQLNERFIEVFKALEAKGIIQKNARDGSGLGDFAERILGNRAYSHIIRAFLNKKDRRVIDYHHARTLCNEYGVNERWMIYGEGSPFAVFQPKKSFTPVSSFRNKIMYTTVEAFAGSTIGGDSFDVEEVDTFSLPGLSGDDLVCFPIKGNSMEPVIENGDLVICEVVNDPTRIKENEIYAIKSNGSLWVKYIQKITNNRGKIIGLRLISANHLEHDPFEEEINDGTRIYKVVRRISHINS